MSLRASASARLTRTQLLPRRFAFWLVLPLGAFELGASEVKKFVSSSGYGFREIAREIASCELEAIVRAQYSILTRSLVFQVCGIDASAVLQHRSEAIAFRSPDLAQLLVGESPFAFGPSKLDRFTIADNPVRAALTRQLSCARDELLAFHHVGSLRGEQLTTERESSFALRIQCLSAIVHSVIVPTSIASLFSGQPLRNLGQATAWERPTTPEVTMFAVIDDATKGICESAIIGGDVKEIPARSAVSCSAREIQGLACLVAPRRGLLYVR